MELYDLPEYKDIPMISMSDNHNGNLPVFVRKYDRAGMTDYLHRHRFIQINYVLSGKVAHVINGSRFELARGDVFVIPPFVPHRLQPAGGSDFMLLELEFVPDFVWNKKDISDAAETFSDFAYIQPFLVSIGEVMPRLNICGKDQITVEELLKEIYTEYTAQPEGFLLAVKADLLKILVCIWRCLKTDRAASETSVVYRHQHELINRAIQYVGDNLTKNLKIEDVARQAMMSRSYFCYVFKIVEGKTFIEFLNEFRVNKAVSMLKGGNEEIKSICFASGFKSVSHFNRVFKEIMGVSPKQYRSAADGEKAKGEKEPELRS